MEISHPFQGVACCCFEAGKSFEDTIHKFLNLKATSVTHHDISCYELRLNNKYYEATIHLFDNECLYNYDSDKREDIYDKCQAIILYGNGQKLTVEQLDKQMLEFNRIGGEPRVLLYHGIDNECEPYKTLSDWCLKNSFSFIDAYEEDVRDELINSLSAYRWKHSSSNLKNPHLNHSSTSSEAVASKNASQDDKPLYSNDPKLDDETMKKLADFDSLLGKLSAFKEQRGNVDKKSMTEIAEILMNLVGEDVDGFLENEIGDT